MIRGMTPELYTIPLRSNPEVYSLGNSITFKPDYLNAARAMQAPEVHGIWVRFTGTVGAVTGGALGRDAAKLFDTIRFRDGADEVLNASGAGLRVLEQMDWGERQTDPADISSGATNTTYSYLLRITFAPPWRSKRSRDFTIPLGAFLNAGEFTVQTAAAVPTGWAALQSDWKLQLFADVRDGRVRELKSRRRIKEEAVTQQEFDYQINGSIRAAILTSKLTTTGYTTLAGFTTLNSRTLKWPAAYQTFLLQDQYRRDIQSTGSNDELLLAAPGAIPLVVPHRGAKIGGFVESKSLHLDLLAAAPTGGRLLTDVVIDRDAQASADTMGYDGPGPLQAAIRSMGTVKGEGDNYSIKEFNGHLARKLPIRIKGK